MMRRLIPVLVLCLALALARDSAPALAQDGPAPTVSDGWASLGPVDSFPSKVVAVSPNWPADPFIMVGREYDLARSFDGGATWERLRLPDSAQPPMGRWEPQFVRSGIGPASTEVWFLLARYITDRQVFRSVDRGASWEPVLTPGLWRSEMSIVLSPTFASDGTAYFVGDGRLYRSQDSGASWITLPTGVDEPVKQALVSPAFAADQTVYVRVAASLVGSRSGFDLNETAHAQSAGVLVSNDGGHTWRSITRGLEVDGQPFRFLQDLAISPTFESDRSLVVLAWGAPRPTGTSDGPRRAVPAHVFGSSDGGESWEPRGAIQWPYPGEYGANWTPNLLSGALTLSPSYASDGVVLLALDGYFTSASRVGCALLRSEDGGRSWEPVAPHHPRVYERCRRPEFHPVEDVAAAFAHRPQERASGWSRSVDLGVTWEPLPTPGQSGRSDGSWTIAPDGTLLVAGAGGAWASGPSARATAGVLGCQIQVGPTFRSAWESLSQDDRAGVGCPTGPEHAVEVEERIGLRVQIPGETGREYVTDDGAPWLFLVVDTPRYARIVWRRPRGERRSAPDQEPRRTTGIVQWTEWGGFLRVERWDGAISVLIAGPGDGRERIEALPSAPVR